MQNAFKWLLGILGLAGVITVGVVLGLLLRNSQASPPTRQENSTTIAQATPLPTQDSPLPTPIVEGTIEPTSPPIPTFTPWPTPTRQPGPTATPLPLPQPADNAAGRLLYAIRTQTDGYSTSGKFLQLQVDAEGQISSPAEDIGLGWMRSYASWDRTSIAFVDRTMGGERIYILSLTTGKITPIKESMGRLGFFLGWYPNNQEILYLAGNSVYGGLWLVNIETEKQTIVVQQDPLYIVDGAMSPDGQRIVYSQQKGLTAPGELWTAFADGSEPKLLIAGETPIGLSWSPDNNKIAYFGAQGLCVIGLENPVCKIVAQNANAGNLFKPQWSPDGRYLAYVAIEPDIIPPGMSPENKQRQVLDWDKEAFIGANIHVINIEKGEEKILVPITPSEQISGHIDPTWSPDGKLIAFAGLHGEQVGVWIVDVDGTNLHQVAEAATLVRFPVWVK